MRQSVITLEKFYASPLGVTARYCGPYLTPYMKAANRVILAMPGGQGAVARQGGLVLVEAIKRLYAQPKGTAKKLVKNLTSGN